MISAKVVADSISRAGKRIVTFEVEYPRFVHSELMTHRDFSRNAASSRAIPISATIRQIQDDPAMPVWWGKNQAGMQAKEEINDNNDSFYFRRWASLTSDAEDPACISNRWSTDMVHAKTLWLAARDSAIYYAQEMSRLGMHKQIVNRILEPWVNIKVVITATEWNNFFALRLHKDAQPEIRALAVGMKEAYDASTPRLLEDSEWHLPYVTDEDRAGVENIFGKNLRLLQLSASLCAQVSYRKADESFEKATLIYDALVNSKPVHASPFEHQAMAMVDGGYRTSNFVGWKQYRSMIPDNVVRG